MLPSNTRCYISHATSQPPSPPEEVSFSRLTHEWARISPPPAAWIIDELVWKHHGDWLKPLIAPAPLTDPPTTNHLTSPAPLNPAPSGVYLVKAGESLKSLSSYQYYVERLTQELHLTRESPIIVIGGGTTLDFGGFLAATLLRGLPWIAIPTSYLAMIDGAIGGKVALNTPSGKNLVGAFHFPQRVWIHPPFLSSYPHGHHLDDLGELIKYALLHPPILEQITEFLSQNHPSFATHPPTNPAHAANTANTTHSLHTKTLRTLMLSREIIMICAKYKHSIITSDPFESSPGGLGRSALNLGHTFGHALETLYQIPHGRAVYWGLVWEGEVLERLNPSYNSLAQSTLALQLGTWFGLSSPPTLHELALSSGESTEKPRGSRNHVAAFDLKAFLAVAGKDKKNTDTSRSSLALELKRRPDAPDAEDPEHRNQDPKLTFIHYFGPGQIVKLSHSAGEVGHALTQLTLPAPQAPPPR